MEKTQLWGTAVVEHASKTPASIHPLDQGDAYSGVYSLLFLLILLGMFAYIKKFVPVIVGCCFRFSRIIYTKEDLSLEVGRSLLFLVSLLHFSVVSFFFIQVYRPDLFETFGWLIIPALMAAFLLFYLFKWSLLLLIGWLIGRPEEFRFLAKSPRDFTILAAIITLPLSLFPLFPVAPSAEYLLMACGGVLVFCAFLFVIRTFRYFLYVRFSIFAWILYLCTLEMAPLALLYRIGLII